MKRMSGVGGDVHLVSATAIGIAKSKVTSAQKMSTLADFFTA